MRLAEDANGEQKSHERHTFTRQRYDYDSPRSEKEIFIAYILESEFK